jgi:hypothetical protein
MVFDQNYYTWGPSNTTQYRAGKEGDIEYEYVYIWNQRFSPYSGLNESMFDWERNYWLYILIDQIFPQSRIMIQDELAEFIQENVRHKYGATSALDFFRMVSISSGSTWNHHIHAHIYLSEFSSYTDNNINLDFDFGEFQNKMNELIKRWE